MLKINSDWLDLNMQLNDNVYLTVDRVTFDKSFDINILLIAEPLGITNISDKYIKDNYSNWTHILTWNEKLLELPNAVMMEFGGCWIPGDSNVLQKDSLCSMICGDKDMLEGHLKRKEVFKSVLMDDRVKKFASKKSSWLKLKSSSLKEIDDVNVERISAFKSKFHICLENCSEKSYFTEKIKFLRKKRAV